MKLPPDLINSRSITNIHNNNYNCLRLTITAWLHQIKENATCESNYVNSLIVPHQPHEDDFNYIIRIQNLYNTNIWLYTQCGNGKIELIKPATDFNKDRKDVRVLAWGDEHAEHCALISNIKILIDRPNKSQRKCYYCHRCSISLLFYLNMIIIHVVIHLKQQMFVLKKNTLVL